MPKGWYKAKDDKQNGKVYSNCKSAHELAKSLVDTKLKLPSNFSNEKIAQIIQVVQNALVKNNSDIFDNNDNAKVKNGKSAGDAFIPNAEHLESLVNKYLKENK